MNVRTTSGRGGGGASYKPVNPELIVLAREFRRVTQGELAEKMGVQQYIISRMEHAQTIVDDDSLARLSRSLDFPPSFFRQDFDKKSLPLTLFRKKKLNQTDTKCVVAQYNIQLMALRKLLQNVDPPDRRIPQATVDDYSGCMETAASDLRAHWQMPSGPVGNLPRLIENAGILIVPTQFDVKGVDGLSVLIDGDQPVIFISNSIPADRFRWTLCHELAHVIFHLHEGMPGSTRDLDQEADRFAASFLMPAKEIRRQFNGPLKLERLAELKRYWRVAMSAIIMRATALEFITPVTQSKLFARMNAMGILRDEPGKFEREDPESFRALVDFHLNQLHYTVGELEELMGISQAAMHTHFPGALRGPLLRVLR